jgi:hypothetical protein
MRFKEAVSRYKQKRILNVERGMALGNYTYLRKINEEKYEVTMGLGTYVKQPDDEYEYVRTRQPLYTIEPKGDQTLITITTNKMNCMTVSHRISKWLSMEVFICDSTMRYRLPYEARTSHHCSPALYEGMQFLKHDGGRMESITPTKTSARFLNLEKSKPYRANAIRFKKFAKLLTAMEAVTYEDSKHRDNRDVKVLREVILGHIEPTYEAVCEVISFDIGWREQDRTGVVNNQKEKFDSQIDRLIKSIYKQEGLYEAKEIEKKI